ncbi:MAG: Fe-S cluster assembly protein SufD [Gammaproteobacteria bacterium]
MNAINAAIQPYAEAFEAFESGRACDAPAWLTNLRREAFTHFAARGFPAERHEDWKYTSTRPLEKRAFNPAMPSPVAMDARAIAPVLMPEASTHTLVFVNGEHAPELSRAPAETAGLHITPLNRSLAQDAAQLETDLVPESIWSDDPFTALNTAFLSNGALIEVADGVQLKSPLQLVFVSTQQSPALACHPRILVKLGCHAQAVLVETYIGLEGAANFTNSYAQIALSEGSQLEHLRLQRESPEDFRVSRVYADQQGNSRYRSHTLNFGGLWVRTDLRTRLKAPGATAAFNGLYLADGRRHVDNHTRIDHLAPNTTSDELYCGIINDRGRAVFNGKVVVAKHAVKADAAQTNNNLLLSRQGEIDTKPELEIYADDVKCSHGATIGQLDEQALFYLRSRGLDPETARGLLIHAFAHTALDRIASPELCAFARRQLAAALPQSAALEAA